MTSPEDEIKDLRERNNELVLKVQYWKMTAAQRENEKLELMKEVNELRLKLSRLRNGGASQAQKLDAALQAASEEALTHLVQASGAVARTIELAKTYMRDRQELESLSPRWSNISGTPNVDKVHRVPPTMLGGQSIQPVVSLSRTIFNTSNRSLNRSPNHTRSVSAVPMHMLQDLYIPLTRIDANEQPINNFDANSNENDLDSETNDYNDTSDEEVMDESQNGLNGDYDTSRRLNAVSEDVEPEDELLSRQRNRIENPLEGPSWLLDAPPAVQGKDPKNGSTLEPDSTTEPEGAARPAPATDRLAVPERDLSVACEFSPTVRRRKRTSPPPASPASPASPPPGSPALVVSPALVASPAAPPSATSPTRAARPNCRRVSGSERVLKVVVAKMRLEGSGDKPAPARSPPAARLLSFDAPSPNGSTSAAVIVCESSEIEPLYGFDNRASKPHDSREIKPLYGLENRASKSHESRATKSHESRATKSHESRATMSHESRGSQGLDGRDGEARDEVPQKRPRKPVTYKEKPLNRKMRR